MINVNQHPFETQKIITADLYKGSLIEKAYRGGDEGLISAEIIRKQLDNKLEKGIIDQELHSKAVEQLEELVKGGEGSRGGHVIGHTKSGKPVYADKKGDHKDYKDWSGQDHLDAAKLHRDKAYLHSQKFNNNLSEGGSYSIRASENTLMNHHNDSAHKHEKAAGDIVQKEHASGLSDSEKKILSDQKKKQLSKHIAAHDHHEDKVSYYEENPKLLHDDHHLEQYNFHKDRLSYHKSEKERLEKE